MKESRWSLIVEAGLFICRIICSDHVRLILIYNLSTDVTDSLNRCESVLAPSTPETPLAEALSFSCIHHRSPYAKLKENISRLTSSQGQREHVNGFAFCSNAAEF